LEAAAGVDLAVDELDDESGELDDEESDEDLVALDDESDELELDDSPLELEPLLALLTDSRLSVR
jgi:hypothetical protein